MKKYIDMTGKRYGRLTVQGIYKRATHGKTITWNCICDCGKECQVPGDRLRQGLTKSCGCLARELSSMRMKKNFTIHGKSDTRLFRIWTCMKNRCYSPNNTHFNCYGGRGIRVCNEWLDNFNCFYNWAISNGYQDRLTLDRINVDGNYEPDNCRWVTRKEQANNRRNNVFLTYKGDTLSISQMAEKYNMSNDTLGTRLKSGWSVERAIETPVQKRKAPAMRKNNAKA